MRWNKAALKSNAMKMDQTYKWGGPSVKVGCHKAWGTFWTKCVKPNEIVGVIFTIMQAREARADTGLAALWWWVVARRNGVARSQSPNPAVDDMNILPRDSMRTFQTVGIQIGNSSNSGICALCPNPHWQLRYYSVEPSTSMLDGTRQPSPTQTPPVRRRQIRGQQSESRTRCLLECRVDQH